MTEVLPQPLSLQRVSLCPLENLKTCVRNNITLLSCLINYHDYYIGNTNNVDNLNNNGNDDSDDDNVIGDYDSSAFISNNESIMARS